MRIKFPDRGPLRERREPEIEAVNRAIHPSQRSGFVNVTNNDGVGAIQSFTY
jgi:hypothetical protein